MGFASKLAQANANAAAGGAPPQPGAPQPGAPQQYPPQGQPQQYAQPQDPQQFYGQPAQQGWYQPAPAAAPVAPAPPAVDASHLAKVLQGCVNEQRIQAFYSPTKIQAVVEEIIKSNAIPRIAQQWRLPIELAVDLAKLALFDVVLLLDDSGSMKFAQDGERIEDLKSILGKVASACGLFDTDGVEVHFLNTKVEANIRGEADAAELISKVEFRGVTPLGTSLDDKILQPMLKKASAGTLRKPLLIVVITDGAPYGESDGKLRKVIKHANSALKKTKFGADAVSYQFAQVGNDEDAQKFLSDLDDDHVIGGLIDQTMDYEYEQAEMMKTSKQHLTPEQYLLKLLLGPIDDSYDAKDESATAKVQKKSSIKSWFR